MSDHLESSKALLREIERLRRDLAPLEAENARLREAAKRAIDLIDTNLYHQREKVRDASSLLKQALNPPF